MQLDLWENKIERAIRRLRDNEPEGEPYYGATSGGKDSIVIMRLAEMANVRVDWHCSLTTVDPPELLRFIRKHHPYVKFNKPKTTMFRLIANHRMPPTRMVRYCCEYFKETGGDGRTVITGVRKDESAKRSKRQAVECFSKNKTTKQVVNPIIDWSTNDVWEFIREEGLPYCELYDEGFKRLGCVGCPMAGRDRMIEQFKRWPHFKALYIKAFDKMLENRLRDGLLTKWTSAEAVFEWWITKPAKIDDQQMGLFE